MVTYYWEWGRGVAHGADQMSQKMGQKWTKNEKKIIKNRIIKRYLKLALALLMKMCQRIYGDLSRGVGSRGHSWG